jgi:hypothetical protein
LDELYRRFIVLADQIKNVQDHHLLELIRENCGQSPRIAPKHVEQTPMVVAAAAGQGRSSTSYSPSAITLSVSADFTPRDLPRNSMAEHHCEQEDYLWGV